jgi:hypothetical protein
LTVFGDLSVVATNNLGRLGPSKTEWTTFHWSPLWNVARVLPWLLALVFTAYKTRSNRSAGLILVPVAVLYGVLWLARTLAPGLPGYL